MTHKDELIKLQQAARNNGMVCTFYYSKEGYIDNVFLQGRLYDPLTFAEMTRPLLIK